MKRRQNNRAETVANALARQNPEPGDILLFHHPERWRSRLIAWFTRSPFYHVALYAGHGEVIEARIPEVMRRDMFTQKDGYQFVVVRVAEREAAEQALVWAEGQIGALYNVRGLVHLVASRLLHWPALCRKGDCPDRFICGNFVVRAYAAAGIDLFPDGHDSTIVPSDFRRFLHGRRRPHKSRRPNAAENARRRPLPTAAKGTLPL